VFFFSNIADSIEKLVLVWGIKSIVFIKLTLSFGFWNAWEL